MKSEILLLVDGHYLAYRSFFAFPTHLSYKGNPVNAVYGFIASLMSVIEAYQPTHLLICFDRKEPTFRHHMFAQYKAHRPPAPEDFSVQIPILHELIHKMGIQELSIAGYEADDLIGTFSQIAQDRQFQTYILSGDMDNMQLVSPNVTILLPQKGGEMLKIGPPDVWSKYGISSDQVTSFKALRGDPSDNIPGVPGVGEKTAVALLQQFKTLTDIYDGIDQIASKSVREKLLLHRESADLSMKLATINRAVPLPVEIDTLEFHPQWDQIVSAMSEFEFKSLVKRYQNRQTQEDRSVKPSIERSHLEAQSNISPQYRIVESVSALDEIIPDLKKGFAIDTETTSKSALLAEMVGISLSTESGTAIYIPLNRFLQHRETVVPMLLPVNLGATIQELPLNPFLTRLKPILEDPNIPKYTHHGKYEWLIFRRYGIQLQGIVFDTMLAAFILYPGEPLGLKSLSQRLLGISLVAYEELTGKGKTARLFSDIPIDQAAQYAAADADMTLRLKVLLQPQLMGKQLELFNEIELPLQIVLAEMEWQGVAINVAYLHQLYDEFKSEGTQLSEQITELAGQAFNLNSPKQISEILFEKLGLPVQKKTKTGTSTDASVLERLSSKHPIAALLLRYRMLEKLNNTYVCVLPQLVHPDTLRIHTSYNQCGAITGRLSSANPNIQNIPIRTDAGKRIRKAFVPTASNRVLLSADYSQIELRILAHLANESALIAAFNRHEDIHASTAATIYRIPLSEVTEAQRYRAKAVNFGIIYGQSAFGLSETLNIARAEAKEMIDRYFATFPNIRCFIDETIQIAEKLGCVETLYGRVRPISDIHSSNAATRQFAQRTAVNTRVQGSAADIIKIAMIRIQNRLHFASEQDASMLIQVHDELVFDVSESKADQLATLVRSEMMGAADLAVPLEVDISWGRNWLDL